MRSRRYLLAPALVATLAHAACSASKGASDAGQAGATAGTEGNDSGMASGSTGGSLGTGGTLGTGGQLGTGGMPGTGGAMSTGGSVGSGGTLATGGMPGSGGKMGSGGALGTGGRVVTGSGGAASGGATGGSSPTGGAPGSGGTPPAPLAFPGAQGFGKMVTGGRNGVVYHVTNLNDSGAGSFRDAVSASNRIIVFDVGGYISLSSAISAKSNLTIAGQSAPGGGIGLRGGELSFANSSNIICRFIRIRPGSETASTNDDALSLYLARDVIIDHASFEFAPWNNIDGVSDDWQNHPVTNITFQDSLIADPTGQQFGAHTESVASQWSWYRNIFASSHNRNPLAKADTVFVNNVLYNDSAGYTTHTSTNFTHDIVNNYFIFGPASTGTDNSWYQIDKNQSIYYAGNLKDTNLNGLLDGTATTPYWYQGTGTVLTAPWSSETTAVPPLDAPSAARVAMSQAGALPRDALDALVISQVMTLGKGTTGGGAGTVGPGGDLYTSQADTGLPNNGYGSIAGGTRPTDTDDDGMPDSWESATGSDPGTADATMKASDGYVLLEHYLAWLASPHAQTTSATSIDIELATYTSGFSSVSPTYTVAAPQNGTVTLQPDDHTARFQPASGFHGVASFTFEVTGTDGTAMSATVSVLVTP